MKEFHFSTAECYDSCPYKFKLQYLDELETLPTDDPANPLILGTAIHRAMETDLETAVQEYMDHYPVIDDRHINEVMKIRYLIPRMKKLIPEGFHEIPFKNDFYMGTADLLVPVGKGFYDLYDFKYSNNIDHYLQSRQLHVYKHYLEITGNVEIRKMCFVFVPKIQIRQGQKESIYGFRKRLLQELQKAEVQIREVVFDQRKVDDFHHTCMKIAVDREHKKSHSYLCDWCQYKEFCKKGLDYMILPKNQRRKAGEITKRKIYIYGDSFTGKTTLVDQAPDPLNLNTDGNIQFVSMPYLQISDQVTVEGRQTKTKMGWEVLKEVIAELQKKDNDFQTIVIDLVEDAFEMCRLYMYKQMGITHESDDAFKAWDKVRTEFFSTIREYFNLPYENLVIISKEDKSRDITRRSGDKITQIKPNIQDKISNKLAGMVDLVVRAVVEDDGTHTLQFKTNEVIFGGGRLTGIKETMIPCTWEALMGVYDGAVTAQDHAGSAEADPVQDKSTTEETPTEKPTRRGRRKKADPEPVEEPAQQEEEQDPTPAPMPDPDLGTVEGEVVNTEPAPTRRRRRRKVE